MGTNYPGSLDAYSRPSASTPMNASGYEGHTVVDNLYDAVEAIETELGTDPAGGAATVKARLDVDAVRNPLGAFVRSGAQVYVQSASSAQTGFSTQSNACYYIPIVGVGATYDRIAISVSAGSASQNARIGLYSDGSNGPTSRIADFGEVSCATTGEKELTISQTLLAGVRYWVAVLNQSSAVAYTGAVSGSSRCFVAMEAVSSSYLGDHLRQEGATYASGLPASAGTTLYSDINGPHIRLRVA